MFLTELKEFVETNDKTVVLLLAAGGVVAITVAAAIVFFIRWRSLGGPHERAARLVQAAHLRQEAARDEAAARYCAALELLCASAGGAARMDDILMEYCASVHRANALAFALPTNSAEEQSPGSFISIDFGPGGLAAAGAQLDLGTRRLVVVAEGSAAAGLGVAVGDELQVLNGKSARLVSSKSLAEMIKDAGAASFRRVAWAERLGDGGGAPSPDAQPADEGTRHIVVCCRCATQNGLAAPEEFFQCLSCQATVLPWRLLGSTLPDGDRRARGGAALRALRCWRGESRGRRPWTEAADLTWETSGLADTVKHPTGCGRAGPAPKDCQHYRQSGAQCGMAAVNNLMANFCKVEVDAEYMLEVSKMLGRAEAELRGGEASAHEQGEETPLTNFYATAGAEHFDVQTLQMVFEKHGLGMWYVSTETLLHRRPSQMFSHDGSGDFVGYVLHRKDKLTSWRDHWFVLRRHGSPPQALLQDSLFDEVFFLGELEAQQLLLSMPQGSVFAVSKLPDQLQGLCDGAGGEGQTSATPAPTTIGCTPALH